MNENILNEFEDNSHEVEIRAIQAIVKSTYGRTIELPDDLMQYETIEERAKLLFNMITDVYPYPENSSHLKVTKSPRRILDGIDDLLTSHVTVDFAIIFSTLLLNLEAKPLLRLVKYQNKEIYQHIYTIIPLNHDFYNDRTNRENYLVLDGVKGVFNEEEPFTRFLDYSI